MAMLVSATGTYDWEYLDYKLPHGMTAVQAIAAYGLTTDSSISVSSPDGIVYASLSAAILPATNSGIGGVYGLGQYNGGVTTTTSFAPTLTQSGSPGVSTVGFGGPSLISTGHTFDTGTVQIYEYTATTQNNITLGTSPLTYQIIQYTNSMLVVYKPVAVVAPGAPGGPPVGGPGSTPPITLQLAQNQDGSYTPQRNGVLTKYDGVPVRQIRAHFGGTRIGVVRPAINGGFLLYEEIANAPSGTIYVYDNTRAFLISIPASQIAQYLA